jgi:hypothetical protein
VSARYIPQWQRDRIDAANRLARRSRCKRCGAPLLVGLDADDVARFVRVDAEPVDRVAEVAALLRGIRSCNLQGGKLWHRDPHHLGVTQYESTRTTQQHEPETEQPIHLEHECAREEKLTLW